VEALVCLWAKRGGERPQDGWGAAGWVEIG